MDGSYPFGGMIPQQGAPAPMGGLSNQANHMQAMQGAMGIAPVPQEVSSGNGAPAAAGNSNNDASLHALSNFNAMAGMNNAAPGTGTGMNMNNMAAGMNMPGGINSNDLNLALLMNLQQQGGGMGGMMNNQFLLQSVMNQGMPQMGGMGVNNLLQQGMMNQGMGGGMGMGLNGMAGMGADPSGLAANNNNAGGAPAPAPGSNNNGNAPPAQAQAQAQANKSPPGMSSNESDLLAQLMQNPMTSQMLAQGLNPMMLLGGGMGGGGPSAAQNQLGGNPLGALGLGGMNGLGGLGNTNNSVGTDAVSTGGLGLNMASNVAAAGGAGDAAGGGTVVPHPTALFAFANPVAALSAAAAPPQAVVVPKLPGGAGEDGSLRQQRVPPGAKSKKQSKKGKVKGKPKRPLSAYNFFFRAERSRILDSIPRNGKKGEDEVKEDKVKKEDAGGEGSSVSSKGGDRDYDRIGDDGKKIPHGKIGFENLAKLIGKRWQELDAEGVEKYKRLADEDMTRYKKEMEVFLTKEAREGAMGTGVDGDLMLVPSAGFYGGVKRKGPDGGEGARRKKIKKELEL